MKSLLKILIILALLLCFSVLIQKPEPFCNCSENFSIMKDKKTLRGNKQKYALTSQINNVKKNIYLKGTPIISNVKNRINYLTTNYF